MKVNEVIIVEGKYDKIRLSNIVDGLIIETDGFGIFKNKEKRELIKSLAEKRGVIILTDSDSAGQMIRNHIKSFTDSRYIKNAYIPEVFGREKRKTRSSREGKLGVEGIDDALIIQALIRAGATEAAEGSLITLSDFFELGLTGGKDSSATRARIKEYYGLPERLSIKSLIQVLGCITTREEFLKLFETKNNPG